MIRFDFPHLEVSETVPGPCDRVWDLLVDTARWPDWGPSVRAVTCRDRRIRRGSTGWVETPLGLKVPFRITELEAGRFWTWRVCGISATGHRVEPQGGGRCRLTFTLPALAAPYAIVCRLAIRRIAALLQ